MNTTYRVAVLLAMLLSLMPAIASAQPPAPKGKLVYEDDFSTSTKSQLDDRLVDILYERGFHPPGVYHIKLLKDNQVHWSLFPHQRYAEFSAQADMWDFSDDINAGSVAQGLVFRAQDNNHFYTVLVNPRNGTYAIRKLDGPNSWSDLVAFKASPLVKRQKDVNHMRVDGSGNAFTVYLNDELLDTFKDASYPAGGVGFIVANQDAATPHMHFDNFKLYSTDTQTAVVQAPLPTTSQDQTAPPWFLLLLAPLLVALGVCFRRLAR